MLEVRDVSKSYGAGAARVSVLHEVSFTLAPGELAAVFGPSGSGKTTLLNVVGTLDRPDGGEMWLDGQALHRRADRELDAIRRRAIGIIFQDFGLLPALTAQENVEMALLLEVPSRTSRRTLARAALARVGLEALGARFPHQLSGGQKQRVGIARALVKRPKLVLADEPTANLDSLTALAVIALLRELATTEGVAFLVATHDERILREATRHLALRDGRLDGRSGRA